MFIRNCYRNVLAALPISMGIYAQTTETLSFIERGIRADGSPAYTNIDVAPSGASPGDMQVFKPKSLTAPLKSLSTTIAAGAENVDVQSTV